MIDNEKIEKIHDLLFEFVPLYFEKFGRSFSKTDGIHLRCNKNQQRAIAYLKHYGILTPTELGKKLGMEKGSLTSLLDSLESRNLVIRRAHPSDRRKYLLVLTPDGEEFFKRMAISYKRNLAQLFNHCSDQEINNFTKDLQNVITFIKKL